jgi:MarR family transcriptional regulator, organic hydroperoxide resistance regulator
MLSDHLCFLIYSANLGFVKASRPRLDELGLTNTKHITIIALWEEDNQTVSGLGEKLFLDSNTLTPMLKRLEVMGYLEGSTIPKTNVRCVSG